jgi:hypothetical protein
MSWSDLHGETYEQKREAKMKEAIYCVVCCDWIPKDQLKIWTGDDMLHHLCPDCDSDLMESEIME